MKPLRQWRYDKGIGLQELAQRSGVSTYAIISIERGRSKGYPRTWRRLADTLGLEPEQIAEYWRAVSTN